MRDHIARRHDSARFRDPIALEREHAPAEQHLAAHDSLHTPFSALSTLHARSSELMSAQFYRSPTACFPKVFPHLQGALAFLGFFVCLTFPALRFICVDPCLSVATSAFAILRPRGPMPINTIIVDDERPARDELIYLLKGFPELNIVALGKNGIEAVALIKEHDPDLVFLDVQMPGLDGFGVIKKLVERKVRLPQIVFATAFDNYAVQAFEVSAVDYVLKPFDRSRVSKAIERAKKMLDAHTSPVQRLESLIGQLETERPKQRPAHPVKLLVKAQSRMILIDADDMIYASIQDGSITLFARDAEGVSNYRTVDELLDALDPGVFWRPHRSYVVNINHIKEVVPWFKSSYMLKMNDKRASEIPVSRVQTKRLRELLKL